MSDWGQAVTECYWEEQSSKGERHQLGREGWEGNALAQWFPHLSLHRNLLEGLLEHRWPRTHPPTPDSKVRGSPRIYIPNRFVVMLVLPVQGPHFENHCSEQREQHGQRIAMAV